MDGKRNGEQNGILNRARKKRAAKGPSPSSSPLQGEERGGKPKRVPLAEVPGGSWKIKRMPQDLKEQLDKLLSDGTFHSCRQLSKWLGDNGFEISHAAIHKYGQKFERRLEAIKMATEQALRLRAIQRRRRADAGRVDEAGADALVRSAGGCKRRADGECAARRCDDRAGEYHGARAQRVGTGEGGDGASEVGGAGARGSGGGREEVEEARAKGLSKEAADQIKAVLMEI